jgi:hypothetical protein
MEDAERFSNQDANKLMKMVFVLYVSKVTFYQLMECAKNYHQTVLKLMKKDYV